MSDLPYVVADVSESFSDGGISLGGFSCPLFSSFLVTPRVHVQGVNSQHTKLKSINKIDCAI